MILANCARRAKKLKDQTLSLSENIIQGHNCTRSVKPKRIEGAKYVMLIAQPCQWKGRLLSSEHDQIYHVPTAKISGIKDIRKVSREKAFTILNALRGLDSSWAVTVMQASALSEVTNSLGEELRADK